MNAQSTDLTVQIGDSFPRGCNECGVEAAEMQVSVNSKIVISLKYPESSVHSVRSLVGCSIKPMIATLTSQMVAKSAFSFDDFIPNLAKRFFPNAELDGELFDGITIRHLLTHTDGLCDDLLPVVPPEKNGYLDFDVIHGCLRKSGARMRPGIAYSYGRAGFMFLGCLLEQVCKKPLPALIHQNLLSQNSNFDACPEESRPYLDRVCPAAGGEVKVSASFLRAFAECFLPNTTNSLGLNGSIRNEMLLLHMNVSGRSVVFKGACMGWKYLGNGWTGHLGTKNGSISFVAMNIETNTVISMIASAQSSSIPFQYFWHRAVNRAFPTLKFGTHAKLDVNAHEDKLSACIGCYRTKCRLICIEEVPGAKLKLNYFEFEEDVTTFAQESSLYLDSEGVAVLSRPVKEIFFVEIFFSTDAQQYLWDGTKVWPKDEKERPHARA